MRFDRRSFIKTTAAFAVAAPAVFRITKVQGAEFSMKYANNTAATHPLSIRTKEAIDAIAKETGGKVDIQQFQQPARHRYRYVEPAAVWRFGIFHAVAAHPVHAGAQSLH